MESTKESKPKVLFLHNRPSGGGGESLFHMVYGNNLWDTKAVMFLTKGFLWDKFKLLEPIVEIKVAVGSSWLGTINNKRWLYIPTRLWDLRRSFNFYKEVRETVKHHKIDIIHSNTMNLMIGGLISHKKNIAHLVHVRELVDLDSYRFPLPKAMIFKIIARYSDYIIANSNRTASGLYDLGVPKEKVRVIYNTVSKPNTTLDVREKFNLPPSQKVVAIVGWINPNKRIEDFLAIAEFFKDRGDITFLVIGPEGRHTQYNQLIKKKAENLPNVKMTGLLDGVINYMKSLSILIATGDVESFGRTPAEALISGTPAIGVRGCAVEEIIDHGETGFLVAKSDIKSLIKFTEILLEDSELCKKMGDRAIEKMNARFGLTTIRKQCANLYYELLNQYKHV